jgi:hypothetical protein
MWRGAVCHYHLALISCLLSLSDVSTRQRRAWELYAAGVFRSLHARKDVRGVVGRMEAADLTETQKAIDSLPFVQMGVLKVDIIPLAPYTGYEWLFAK